MAFCAFDEGVAGFDVTPVENMFISEYMLGAPGEYVKVYLYGLMLCYHNQARMSLTSMARDLKSTEDEVERAFRYWERNGLVRRVGDNPVCYAYKNIKQLTLTRAQDPAEKLYNRAFMDEVRRIIGEELADSTQNRIIFDWIDVFEFPEDVVLMLLEYEKKRCGNRRLSLAIADKTAKDWAHRGVRTIEDAEKIVFIDNEREKALNKLIRDLGQVGFPSEDQKKMYNKWVDEWGFTAEIIEKGRTKTANRPTMGYLNAVLQKWHTQDWHTAWEIDNGESLYSVCCEVFKKLGRVAVMPTKEDENVIGEWLKNGHSKEMIEFAASEVHERRINGTLQDIERKLLDWKQRGIASVEQLIKERDEYRNQNKLLFEIYRILGTEKKDNDIDRERILKWQNEMKLNWALICCAAERARGIGDPMKTVDSILTRWHKKGIRDVQAARAEHEAHVRTLGGAKPAVSAQDAMLRYTPEERRATYSAAVVDLDEEVR